MTEPTTDVLARLQSLADDEFRELLSDRLADEDLWQAVMQDHQLCERADIALVALINRVQGAMSRRKSDLEETRLETRRIWPDGKTVWIEAKAEHSRWLHSAMGRRRLLDSRLGPLRVELKKHRVAANARARGSDASRTRDAIRRLTMAVREHQRAVEDEGMEPEVHDRILWAALEEITIPYGGGELDLATLVDSGSWHDRGKPINVGVSR